MIKRIDLIGLLIPAMILLSFTVAVSASGSFSWTTVAIGGGGFVSGIVSSPIEKNLFYARTDVGGAYRWDQSLKQWIPLMDWADGSELGLFGVEAIEERRRIL
jgi:xyloglucan-specific exo-beta-1,4-glucanase